jgi:signal transduction histidine kinase/CheY-like chemotaxis protein
MTYRGSRPVTSKPPDDTLAQLEARRVSPDTPMSERVLILEALVERLVTLSRHREAIRAAQELFRLLGVSGPSRITVWVCTRLLSRSLPHNLDDWRLRLLRLWLRVGPGTPLRFESVRAIQFAFFWQDIERCTALSTLQLALAREPAEIRQACAWLGYALTYARGSKAGLMLLRKTIARMHHVDDQDGLVQTYPLLAIAYQAALAPVRAVHYHELYLSRYADRNSFYTLLVLTNFQSVYFSLKDFAGLRRSAEKCFAGCFSLEDSRHHLQLHGWRGVLLAAEGRREEAVQCVALARRAAQNTGNNLDWTIFHRLGAVVHTILANHRLARKHVALGLRHNKAYGSALFYQRDLRRLDLVCQHLTGDRPGDLDTLRYATSLFAGCSQHAAATACVVRRPATALHEFGTRFDAALRSSLGFDTHTSIGPDDLQRTLSNIFDTPYVLVASSLSALRERAAESLGVDELSTIAAGAEELRLVCPGGLVIGYECPQADEVRERLAVAILLKDIDIDSELLMKTAMRVVLAQYVFVRAIHTSRKQYAAEKRVAALGQLSRRIAHDVRQPFAMLKVAIETLSIARDPEEFRDISVAFLADVERSSKAAETLIQDVLAVGSQAEPQRQLECSTDLIRDALSQVFVNAEETSIDFEYELSHQGRMNVDRGQILRVLCNVLTNALEATNGVGLIWFRTQDVERNGQSMVELTVGNSGPRIPPSDVEELFDPLYTRGKRGGTGLGLAIAQKIVMDHSGVIGCIPSCSRGVEFWLCLPATRVPKEEAGVSMPAHSSELFHRSPRHRLSTVPEASLSEDVVSDLVTHTAERARSLYMAVIDDEPVYRRWLIDHVKREPRLRSAVTCWSAGSYAECIERKDWAETELFVVDVDLGAQQEDGLELVQKLRELGSHAFIAVHSNRTLPQDLQAAAAAGADACIPKPMSPAHLGKLLHQVVMRAVASTSKI